MLSNQYNHNKTSQWSQALLKQCKAETGLMMEDSSLTTVNQDFGRLASGKAVALWKATTIHEAQTFVTFAHQHQLPITIRSQGLSQSGQSLAPEGAVVLDISNINPKLAWKGDSLIAGCSVSWKSIVESSLTRDLLPEVIPYNTDLTVGGVLSVGGLGASTFKQGVIGAHVLSLTVLTANGTLVKCSPTNEKGLFDGCLSGVGLFGIIIDAELSLRPCKKNVRIYTLSYDDYTVWLKDQFSLKEKADYLEAFITDDRSFANRALVHCAFEYDNQPPELTEQSLHYHTFEHKTDMSILDFTYRHDPRLQGMKDSGKWDEMHPWYECYVDCDELIDDLDDFVERLDKTVGGIYHVFPVDANTPKYFMLPNQGNVVTFNVLSPGLGADRLKPAIDTLVEINDILLKKGGKRYISGWFYGRKGEGYWQVHYGNLYDERKNIKHKYDPNHIFCSQLFPDFT